VRLVPGEVVEMAEHRERPWRRRQAETDGRAAPAAAVEAEEWDDYQEREEDQQVERRRRHGTPISKVKKKTAASRSVFLI
jgi:hypothetical protein